MSSKRIVALSTTTRPSIPELGRIRLGDHKVDPKKPGKPLPFFRVDFNSAYKHLEPLWNELYPEPPATLDNIFMPYPNAEDAFTSAFEDWTAAEVLQRRCDGATIHQWYNPATQRYEFIPKTCQCAALAKPVCRLVGRLSFVVKDFYELCQRRGVHALGYFLMATSSRHNIARIDGLLQGIQAQYGKVNGIPFRLERVAEEVSTPIPANEQRGTPATRIMKTHYLITLRTADAFNPFAAEALLTVGAQPVALSSGATSTTPQLPATVQTDDNGVIDSDHRILDGEQQEVWECNLLTVTVAKDKNGARYLKFTTDLGDLVAYRRSRDIFKTAGAIKESDWMNEGTYKIEPYIAALIEQDEHGYWQVVEVAAVK